MPPMTTIRKFIEAVQTRKTIINKALDAIFTDSGRHKSLLAELSKPGAFNRPLADWARPVLQEAGLDERDVAHIDKWPDQDKEEIRKAVVNAIETNRNVRFLWELHGGSDNVTEVRDDAKSEISVTFRSPQSKVRVSKATFGDISVDV